ncbi:MAG: 4-deoxy-4-formamido-L-arabinose-phosphoundecaprenol deformylase [Acidobacteriota bacterium]|jgi:undecaprenyl phosphate-alpha-L-ara4FN deformylase
MGTFIGLRVDVDTFRGTRTGVPELVRILDRHGVHASFFFSVGPDNMGRHLWRLLRPAFLIKMLRTNAAGLYGWDILLRGTLWPGPVIGRRLAEVIRSCASSGHEIGLHAWDHHRWQRRVAGMDSAAVHEVLTRGFRLLEQIGAPASCTAAPAWRCTDAVLDAKLAFQDLRYNSDCRGEGVFVPVSAGRRLPQPQVPVNLPTFDEIVGTEDVTPDRWNDFLMERIREDGYNVLTVHAEVEGIACAGLFDDFLSRCTARGWEIGPLSRLVPADPLRLPAARIVPTEVPGREGWISVRG